MVGLLGEASSGSMVSNSWTGHVFRDALRLLFILVQGGQNLPAPSDDWDRVFVGEKRALAIDFWIRYPDYLADELLDLYEANGDEEAFEAACTIFEREEPDVRVAKMIRWRRGAYDDLQTSLAVLASRQLVRTMKRKLPAGGWQYEFMTGVHSRDFLAEAVDSQPVLGWYERQTYLALKVAGGMSGSALKEIHYEDPEYAFTPYGSPIPSIRDRVLDRIRRLKEPSL